MNRWQWCASLAVMAGFGFGASVVQAQVGVMVQPAAPGPVLAPQVYPPGAGLPGQLAPPSAFATAPATGAGDFSTAENNIYEPVPGRPIRNAFHRMGVCCWTHFNTFGCGSLHADWLFVFGSCRQFFGEPCYRGPPEPPLPPGYRQGQGDGQGDGQRGCACQQ
jgi:hypothetical protein